MDKDLILRSYEDAKKVYKSFGVDTDKALEDFKKIPVSLHCWQGDDVKGFEEGESFSQNLVTGNYKGAARNGAELRNDIDEAFSMSPLKHRVNLHSMYQEGNKERNEVTAEDFQNWVDWAKAKGYAIDFNASFFTHEKMNNGFSLASPDKATRDYWIKAGKGAREISNEIASQLGEKCYNNIWVPDGLKDIPASRMNYRLWLEDSLDQILDKKYDKNKVVDTLEGKLFGIGTECFVVGSHEFYMGYAIKNGCGICMDTGHYHPTETVVDKLSAASLFVDDILLHVSRGVRWDSDHVLIQSDDLYMLMQELKRGELFGKIGIGLDYFDASINRIAAWTIGLRAAAKSIISALVEPTQMLFEAEAKEDFTTRLALTDEFRNLPVNAVYDKACLDAGIPVGAEWIRQLKKYEAEVQDKRN